MNRFFYTSLLSIFLTAGFVGNASAELTIRITQGIEGALPIAVVPLGWPRGRYGPTTRRPVGDVVSLDRYGNRCFQAAGGIG